MNPMCLSLLKVVSVCNRPLFGLGSLCGNLSPNCNLLKTQKRPELVPVFVFSFRLCSLISHSKQVQHRMGCLPVAVLLCVKRRTFTHFCKFPVSSSHWPIVNGSLAFCFTLFLQCTTLCKVRAMVYVSTSSHPMSAVMNMIWHRHDNR